MTADRDQDIDVRQVDLWECTECSVANMNVGQPRECSSCGAELEYLGEVDYRNKSLVPPEGSA